ncbi:unnamed protein product [Adineta ricciae]|uniref:Uncharacterized protein n=1 Tax=Adineta ricciae TaxID=249248 RepID=A0A815DEE1_ADIRI|nr:unnamed protein product [Adineta ricciae]
MRISASSPNNQRHPDEVYTVIESFKEMHRAKDDDDSDILTIEVAKKNNLRSWILVGLFVSISLIIGVLVVCLTVPKQDHTCQFKFRQTMKSSVVRSSQPRSIAVGDFNKDQQLDIVAANSGTDTIVVFNLDTNGTILTERTYATGAGSRPCSVVVSDFNQDGYVDIAVANNGTNSIGLFINNGSGSFFAQQVLSTSSFHPFFLATGDFNHDNYSDIAAVYYGTDNIGIHLADYDGTFRSGLVYSTGYDSFPHSLAVGDLNQDNQLDITVANYGTNNIGIFIGQDNGIFINKYTYSTAPNSHPSSVTLGDVNQDNHLDILVCHYGLGSIGIFVNRGDSTFASQILYPIDSQYRLQFITVGYIDTDQYLDVVIADSENDRIHILPGYDNASFGALTTYDFVTGSNPSFIAVVDFDKDNRSDLVVTNDGKNSVDILCDYSSKPSVRQTTYFVGRDSRPSSVVIHDFNKDGQLDALVDNFNSDYVVIFNGIGKGKFIQGDVYPTGMGSAPQYMCLGDLNADNRTDMVVVNLGSNSLGIFFGNEDGTFQSMKSYSTGTQPWFAAVGDLDNDTYLDIVAVNLLSSSISIFLNDGSGNFSRQKTFSTGTASESTAVTIGDLSSDGYLDLAVTLATPPSIGVFLGVGNGSFGDMIIYSADCGGFSFMVVFADLNRDRHLDIVITCPNEDRVFVFFGIGDGTFPSAIGFFTGSNTFPYYVYINDFNNDQHLDIATTCSTANELVIFYGDSTENFILARRYSTGIGSGPYAITAADLNHDEHLEYVVTYWSSGYFAVLTEYDAAEFSKQFSYNTGSAPHPYSLATGDFNDDNQADVVVANSDTDSINILFGLNNGMFSTPTIYSTGTDSSPQYVITGDVDKDSRLDIISLNAKENTMSIIMNNGNGSFAQQKKYTTGSDSFPSSIVMGDLNNDNRSDFVIANKQSDSIGFFIGFDYTSFQNPFTYSLENARGPSAARVCDVNGDTYLDMVVLYQVSGLLGVFLGHGNGSFTLSTLHSTEPNVYPSEFAIADFNKDDHVDIAVIYFDSNVVSIFLGYGNGNFSNTITFSTETNTIPRSLTTGDVNNDDQVDIVTVNTYADTISIFLGEGTGNFTLIETYLTEASAQPQGASIGDLNKDGNMDIAVCNYYTSTTSIFLGYGNGSFQAQVLYSVGYQTWANSINLADFNNDSILDIVVTNYNGNNVAILLGLGNGTFSNVSAYSIGDGAGPTYQSIGDFNNDQILDIAVVNTIINTVVILFGFGDGTFLLGTTYSAGANFAPGSIASGDFNHDGQSDIILTNFITNTIIVFVDYDRHSYASVIAHRLADGSQPHSVALGDLNDDGWLDIVVANYGTDNIGILLGLGNALFSSMITYSTGNDSHPLSLAIADLNHDSHLDIVVSNSETNNVAFFHGYSNGTFTLTALYSTGVRSQPFTITVGDVNNDNNLDLIVANSGTSNIFVLHGYGNGTFGNETSYPLGYESLPYSVALADLNNDERIDMVIATYGTENIDTLVKMCD